jgi:hypothetical protein
MNQTKRITCIAFIALATIIFLSNILTVKSQPPLLPMTISGYVFIQKVDGTKITAPEGLYVYAKEGTVVINVQDTWTTDVNGYYSIGVSASTEGAQIDMWVQNINVTRITFHSGTFIDLNLTVIDETSPSIQILSPEPNAILPPNQPVWINATLTDNFVLNASTILLTLNGTKLTPTYNAETGLVYYQTSPLTIGLYNVSLSVEDLAGNPATKTWSFTVAQMIPPTVTIISPTTANPLYTQSAKTVRITYNYTEANPKNATIIVYNSTNIIATATITNLTGGTNIQRIDNITIPAGTAEGPYNINVTIYNIYELSAIATQLNAIIVDNTKPVIVISYPAEGSYISAKKVWINGTVTEVNIGALKPSINDTRFTLQEWNSATGKFAYLNNTAIQDGKITLIVNFTDLAQNTASATRSFTLDTTAPTITGVSQSPPANNVQPTDTVEVTATVTDTLSGVKSVTLYYSVDGGATWTNVSMTPIRQVYKATIPAFPIGTRVQYYIEALDNAGNRGVSPEAEYYIYTVIPEFQNTLIILLTLLVATSIATTIKRRKSFSTN